MRPSDRPGVLRRKRVQPHLLPQSGDLDTHTPYVRGRGGGRAHRVAPGHHDGEQRHSRREQHRHVLARHHDDSPRALYAGPPEAQTRFVVVAEAA